MAAIYSGLFKHVLLPTYAKLRGKPLPKMVAEYNSHLTWSPEQIKAHQWQYLSLLLEHAFTHSTFYRSLWQKAGVESAKDITDFNAFTSLPIISKEDISAHYEQVRAHGFKDNIVKATGGSTGIPFKFELDVESNLRREAVMWRGYQQLGAGLGEKTLFLWGANIGEVSKARQLKKSFTTAFIIAKC